MRKIIVTDLTRFANSDIVCTAGIDPQKGECIRPMPYLKWQRCKELNILPGAILEGVFSKPKALENPHLEDMNYDKMNFVGPCSSGQFRKVLIESLFPSVEKGFEATLSRGQKHIPFGKDMPRSIITLKIDMPNIEVVMDKFNNEKVKLHFTDQSGESFRFMPITDLGFHSYAKSNKNRIRGYADINEFLHAQKEIYLRIGLSRRYTNQDGRDGYWIQVNGIYSFPEFLKDIRCYKA